MAPAAIASFFTWCAGRKTRLKLGDLEIEAPASREVGELFRQVAKERRRARLLP